MKTTTESNKLIAEFMKFQKTDIGWYDFEETLNIPYTTDNTFDILQFNTSWDWLMPVVKNIDDLGYEEYSDIELNNRGEGLSLLHIIQDALKDVSLRGTYDAVVEFIKWYNQNK